VEQELCARGKAFAWARGVGGQHGLGGKDAVLGIEEDLEVVGESCG
jgi:hypothetical protein